jgi:hypothetical protein
LRAGNRCREAGAQKNFESVNDQRPTAKLDEGFFTAHAARETTGEDEAGGVAVGPGRLRGAAR